MAVAPKAKRRNSEKRKEHSRDAARSRRSREAEVFLNLAQEIPLPYDLVKLLDKTSIIRLTISYLKLRTLLAEDLTGNDPSITSGHLEQKLNQLYHRALDGFLMVVASDGDILFVSDNIAGFLGLTQIDVMGQSIYDLSHPCDHDEIREMIGVKSHPSDDSGHHRDIFIRMKSTITSKGRSVHIKSASYKVISCSGHLKTVQVCLSGEEEETVSFVVIIGQSIGHPLSVEVPLDSRTFVSRHSLDMKFTECDERIHKLVGYRADELLGRSMYSYQHALDTEALDKTFKTLFCKGQASTGLYRFLAQSGGFVWLETHATVINNIATDKPECVVCLNYVVSGVECEDVVFDVVQLCPKTPPPDYVNKMECDEGEETNEANCVLGIGPDTCKDDEQDSEQMCMQFVTEKILEQAVKEKDEDDSESAMIHRMTCYLLDRSSEMPSRDQSLYSINKPVLESHDVKTSDVVGCESEEGMTKNFSNSSLSSLLDKMEDGMEMRAPYIPMDDLVFSSVETPLVQSFVSESQLSCLMNSDPLLPSVSRDLSDPISSLFTMNLSEIETPSSHVTLTQKSSGTKRSYGTPDVIDLTAVPCKVPRLDSSLSLDRSSTRQAPVSTVTMLTGPVIHVPPFTTSQGDVQKQITSIGTKPEQQVTFFPVTNLIGAPEKKRPAAAEVGSGGQQMESPQIIYLMLNGQLTPVKIATDRQLVTTRCDAVETQSDQQKLQPSNRGVQLVVSRGGDAVGPGNSVLDLTSPGSRTIGMVTTGDISAPQIERATKAQTCTTFLGTNKEHKMLMHTPGKSGDSCQLTANQMMTNLNGQDLATSKTCSTLPNQQPRLPSLTSEQLLRLIAPSLRKALNQKPVEQLMPRGGTATQEQYHRTGGDTHGAVNSTGRGTDVVDGEEGLPLHLKLRGGCVPVKQVLPDFLKVLESENKTIGPLKPDGLISKLSILNGSGSQPLHLLQERVAATRYPPRAGMGQLPVEGSSVGGTQKFFIPPGTASVVVNPTGQQSQRPRAQVIIKSIRQQPTSALKGIGLQVAAPHTSGSSLLMRQNGDASEAGYSQHLTSPCSGSVLDTSGSSVLMNLLMKGVDVNYGYRLQSRMGLDGQKQLNMG